MAARYTRAGRRIVRMDLSRQHLAARLNEPAFVDDDPGRAFSRQRDSHDLAFRGGRSSVMDNMLRSLDQMQEPVSLVSKFHHYDADYLDQQHRMLQYQLAQERQSSSASGPQGPDYPSWSAGHSPPLHRRSLSQPKTSPVRRREHTHSSSYSSAYNARLSDELNRRSSHQPHARRSNSVSTSHSSLYRHDTVPLPFSGSAAHGQPRLPVLARPYGDTIPTTSPHGSRLGHASGGGSFGPSSFKLGQESASTTAYESAGRNYAGHKASTDHGRSGYDGLDRKSVV